MTSKHLKIIFGIALTVLLLLGAIQFVQGFIDTRPYRQQIEEAIRAKTDQDITIRGNIKLTLLPTPTLYVPNVELREKGSDTPSPALTVDMVYIKPSISSLFSGVLKVSGITLERPLLEINRSKDNLIRWGWLNSRLLQLSGPAVEAVTIDFIDGSIAYHNARVDKDTLIQGINATTVMGGQPRLNGSLTINGQALQFDARTEPAANDDGTLPVNITLSADKKAAMTLEGTVNFTPAIPEINGKITISAEDVLAWFKSETEDRSKLFDQFTGDAALQAKQQKFALPLSITGDWKQSESGLKITITGFQGINSAGAGIVAIDWTKTIPHITADFNFSALSYDHWKILLAELFKDKDVAQVMSGYKIAGEGKENPLPSDMEMVLNINAKQVYFGSQIWSDAKLSAVLDKAMVTINQFDVHLPGESSLTLFGVISQSSTKEMRFEGSMETSGKSLRQMLTVLDESAIDLPEPEFGQFYVRSNIYAAPDQVRLSEADVKINDLHLNGGLVAYYNVIPRLEADVRLKDINFDYFRDSWRKKQKTEDKNVSFNWLKKLKASIDFKIMVDGFTFFDRKGDNASFRLFVQEGGLGIYNIQLNYPEDALQGSISLDVKGEQPYVNILLNTGMLDTNYFAANEEAENTKKEEDKEKHGWSEDLIDMSWMEGWKGAFDITISKLLHGERSFDNVKMRAMLENNLLSVQSLAFTYWQGKCSVTGSLYGGKVPGFSAGFTIYNAELQELLQSLIRRDNIAGKVSISGTLATSGVNALSWVSQAESELVLAGRGVSVDRFSLQGVIDAVAVSRTAADVLNNVNLALAKGSTEMSIDANINIKGGIMRSPGVTLKSGNVIGNMTGSIKLVPKTMELSSLYQFPGMGSETVPTMTVQLIGDIDKPEMHVDTASLEAYVAKRITGSSGGR